MIGNEEYGKLTRQDVAEMIAEAIEKLRKDTSLDSLEQDLIAMIETKADDCDVNSRLNHLEMTLADLEEGN